jgi:hypothetical protein
MNFNMEQIIKEMLIADLEAQRKKAILTLHLLSNNAAGIGDHSTSDFYKNAHEALEALTDADDKLETINKYQFKLENGQYITYKNGEKL